MVTKSFCTPYVLEYKMALNLKMHNNFKLSREPFLFFLALLARSIECILKPYIKKFENKKIILKNLLIIFYYFAAV